MVPQQAQHVMTNIPTKYEHILLNAFRGVAVHKILLCYTMYKIVTVLQLLQIMLNCNGDIPASCYCMHVMTKMSIKYEHILLYGFRGVAFTSSYYVTLCIKYISQSPPTSTNFVASKWCHSRFNYIPWHDYQSYQLKTHFILQFQRSCIHKVLQTDGDHYYVPLSWSVL